MSEPTMTEQRDRDLLLLILGMSDVVVCGPKPPKIAEQTETSARAVRFRIERLARLDYVYYDAQGGILVSEKGRKFLADLRKPKKGRKKK